MIHALWAIARNEMKSYLINEYHYSCLYQTDIFAAIGIFITLTCLILERYYVLLISRYIFIFRHSLKYTGSN